MVRLVAPGRGLGRAIRRTGWDVGRRAPRSSPRALRDMAPCPTMPFMTGAGPPEPRRSDSKITERTAENYRGDVISELEGENNRLRERADTLQRALNERTS